MNRRPERLSDLLPGVVADLARRHGIHPPTLTNRSDSMTDRDPRVWFDNEDIPCGVHVLDEDGEIHLIGDGEEPIGEPQRMIGFGPLVEVQLPNHRAAVAAERARRDGAA